MMKEEKEIKELSYRVERTCWLLILCGMLTQVSQFAFPSYNIAIGFWGAYCAFQKHGRATFGLIIFTFLSIIFDIVFAALSSGLYGSSQFQFCITFFFLAMVAKAFLCVSSAHFFAAIGGAQSMANSGILLDRSSYEPLDESQTAAYFSTPDQSHMKQSTTSLNVEEV